MTDESLKLPVQMQCSTTIGSFNTTTLYFYQQPPTNKHSTAPPANNAFSIRLTTAIK